MRIISAALIVITFLFLNVKCKTDKIQIIEEAPHFIKGTIEPFFGNENLHLDSTYTTQQGYDIQFSNLKFYLEDIKNDGIIIVEGSLFNYRDNGTSLFRKEFEKISSGTLTANLGVGPNINHLDPSAFENTSPLNILNANDMHWNWNPGYIFLKIEAKVDTIQDGIALFNHNVVYHIGLDENLQTIQFQNMNWTQVGDESQMVLKIDLNNFLNVPDVIDVKTEFSSHSSAGQEILTAKVISNFSLALSPN
mgnify:CR=1 FL=1|tara:strand:- start:266 stop:1015 length:750 start_codon:yes stop_codon:yes gene_type:complete